MKYPEVGDKLWMVHDGYPILIRVTITGNSYGDFIVDEPTGNPVEANALFDNVEAAADRMLMNVKESQELWFEDFDATDLVIEEEMALEQYRGTQRDWVSIVLKFGKKGSDYGGVLTTRFPDKPREDWLTLRQVRELRGMPLIDFEELYS